MVLSNNYYPFGLQHATNCLPVRNVVEAGTRSTTLKNNRLYNAGAELNEQTKNYETFYRDYDAAIGRFTAIEPMAAKYSSLTPYNFGFNNPVNINDPTGADPYSGLSRYQADWGQGTIMDYGPLQRPGTNMQYMAGRADLWGWSFTGGSGFYGSSLVGGPAHVAPGSAGDWAVGVRGFIGNIAVMSRKRFLQTTGLDIWKKEEWDDITKFEYARMLAAREEQNKMTKDKKATLVEDDTGLYLYFDKSYFKKHKEPLSWFRAVSLHSAWYYYGSLDSYFFSQLYMSLGEGWQNGRSQLLYASMLDNFLSSAELAVAGLKPSFDAAAYDAFKNGGKGSVPFFLKKNIFKSYKAINNNAIRLGKISSTFAKNGAAVMKFATPALTATAIVTNGYSILSDGELTWGDAFVAVNTGLQVVFPAYGVIYGVVDVGTSLVTGTSLTDYTKNAIDSNVNGSLSIGWSGK